MISISSLVEELQYRRLSASRLLLAGTEPRRKVPVNGCPKSGTTWMVRLLASLPGYREAGNFRGEIGRYQNVERGDVVHGHDPFETQMRALIRAEDIRLVLLSRDPRDQAVSRFHHARRDESHPFHRQIRALDIDGGLMASIEGGDKFRGASSSIQFIQDWEQYAPDALSISYEDLTDNTNGQFTAVLDYLRSPLAQI